MWAKNEWIFLHLVYIIINTLTNHKNFRPIWLLICRPLSPLKEWIVSNNRFWPKHWSVKFHQFCQWQLFEFELNFLIMYLLAWVGRPWCEWKQFHHFVSKLQKFWEMTEHIHWHFLVDSLHSYYEDLKEKAKQNKIDQIWSIWWLTLF